MMTTCREVTLKGEGMSFSEARSKRQINTTHIKPRGSVHGDNERQLKKLMIEGM